MGEGTAHLIQEVLSPNKTRSPARQSNFDKGKGSVPRVKPQDKSQVLIDGHPEEQYPSEVN